MCTGRWTGSPSVRTAIEQRLARRHLADGALVLYDLSSSWVEGSTARWRPVATPVTEERTGRDRVRLDDRRRRAGRSPSRCSPVTPPTHRVHLRRRRRARPVPPALPLGGDGRRPGDRSPRHASKRSAPWVGWAGSPRPRAPAIRALAEGGVPETVTVRRRPTWPRSPITPTIPVSVSSPVATRPSPRPAATSETSCWPPPRRCSSRSPLSVTPAVSSAPTRSRSVGKVDQPSQMASTSASTSPTLALGYTRNDVTSRPKRRRTDLHRAYLPRRWPPRRRRCHRRLQRMRKSSRPTSEASKRSTWTSARSATGPPNASASTCSSACSPPTSRLAPTPSMGPDLLTDDHPQHAPTPSPQPDVPPEPRPKAYANAPTMTNPPTASPPSSTKLATLTRNQLRARDATVEVLATPTTLQRRAFELIGAPVPHKLT